MEYFCAKCGTRLRVSKTPWTKFYSVDCFGCGTNTNVKAGSDEDALRIVGVTDKEFNLEFYKKIRTKMQEEPWSGRGR